MKKERELNNILKETGSIKAIYDIISYGKQVLPKDMTNVVMALTSIPNDKYSKYEDLLISINKVARDITPAFEADNHQGYFVVITGENGNSNFYSEWEQMTKVNEILQEKCSWYSLTEAQVDIPDNISYWAFTFKLK